MAVEIDLSKKLSKKDIEYLRTRYPEPRVQHMIKLAGSQASQETEEPQEAGQSEEETPETTEDAPEPQEGEEQASEGEEDLIGDVADDTKLFDPLQHTVKEVQNHLDSADDDERQRVKAVEEGRTDREPRVSVTGYNPS